MALFDTINGTIAGLSTSLQNLYGAKAAVIASRNQGTAANLNTQSAQLDVQIKQKQLDLLNNPGQAVQAVADGARNNTGALLTVAAVLAGLFVALRLVGK